MNPPIRNVHNARHGRGSFCAILLAVSLGLTGQSAWAMPVEEVPNPQTRAGSFVQDSAGILSPDYLALIDQICRQLEQATSAEMAVVTVDSLDGLTVEDYAVRLFERLGPGKKDADNGLLILLSQGDRRIRIEVGYGLEGVINDAKAGRILDEHAIPFLKTSMPGRALYETAKSLALEVASDHPSASSIPFSLPPDPESWPLEADLSSLSPAETQNPHSTGEYMVAILKFVLALFAFSGFCMAYQSLRVRMPDGRAGKTKLAKKYSGGIVGVWIFGIIGLFVIMVNYDRAILAVVGFIVSVIPITLMTSRFSKRVTSWASQWRPACPGCRQPMSLTSDRKEIESLTPEEIAEQRAGGMDYELWYCNSCGQRKRFEVRLDGASRCSACKRRTLVHTTTTLIAATTSSRGRARHRLHCHNPACSYEKTYECSIPKIPSASSSSSGHSSSSGGSFGGGSSGGGGASRGW